MTEQWEKLDSNHQPWEGEVVSEELATVPILLTRIDGQLKAYHDCCAHNGVRVSTGHVEGTIITCPAHKWQYDLRSGEGVNPKKMRLRSLPLMTRDGEIYIDIGSVIATKVTL